MTSVGYATLDVIPSFRGLQAELDKGTVGPLRSAGMKGGTQFGDAAGKAGGARFGAAFKKVVVGLGLAKLGMEAFGFAKESISAASDLEESTNKVSQVFGSAADNVLKFTAGTADALGQTNTQAREAAATFGIFGSAAGLADKKNARFAKRMTTLASDLASFNNTEPDQAVQALGAALRGESEPIRAYGVMLDEATLKAEALALGILKPVKDQSKIFAYQTRITDLQKSYNEAVAEHGKGSLEALKAEASLGTARTALQKATEGTIPPLTQQQKLLAAQSQIFKQTEVAQGDFARTSDGLANQQRRLAARFEDAKARLGTGLLPIMTKAADFLLDKGIPAFERFSDWFTNKGVPGVKNFVDQMEPAIGFVKDLAGAFNDLSGKGKLTALGSALAGGILVKHKVAGIFDRGGIANPMFVTVTNPGFGTDIPGGGKPGSGTKVPPVLAGNSSLLNKFIKMGGPGGLLALAGIFADRGVVDHKGDPAKIADEKRTQAYLDSIKRVQVDLDAARAKAAGFGDELDLVGARKVTPQVKTDSIKTANDALAKFIGYQIDAGRPVTPYINTTSIERAIALARTLDAALRPNAVPTAGVDNGAGYMHGGTPDANPRAGINFNGPINVQAHDYDDFTRKLERKTQRAGLGGRP